MSKITNSSLIQEIRDVAKTQVGSDILPTTMTNQVVPVIDVNPKHARVVQICKTASITNQSSATVYTTPTDKDFYITALALGLIKDATATTIYVNIKAYVDGVNSDIITLPCITLTAQNIGTSLALTTPIKVDKNTAITLNSFSNNANITAYANVHGYEISNIKA